MINGKRIAVVLPAYNAEKTLENTVSELPDVVDIKILVDDIALTARSTKSRNGSGCNITCTTRITDTGATNRPVTAKR